MKYRNLGQTGLVVSEIGFGAWGIGGVSYGPVNDSESIKALQFAFDNGVTFYDTADSYGNGHSEKIIGNALKRVRGKIIIATKVGCLPHGGREMPQDFTTKHINQSIEASLSRLRTDYIDLYQLHSPPMSILFDDKVIRTLENLKSDGKVRVIGISARSPDDGLIAIKKYGFSCVQVNFNLTDHRPIENGLISLAERDNIGIIARTPLNFGFLAKRYTSMPKFEVGDHRMNWPKEQLEIWAKSPDLFSALYKSAKCTPAQAALRFCLSFSGISSVIPGMMNSQEVFENIHASSLSILTEDELEMIRKIYKLD